ncbi:PLP-dependent aminotransferase family protein [Humitalea sp. 24SJ18S-53]|uniref:aminotransferase-like domain-containing protein n=1 Tax=Humitalea sp. 24SJ18S-53 TaxID=3422307 RepID=UPI003D66C6C1
MTDFRILADTLAGSLANDLAAGRRKPGDRLVPSREYAHRQGIAPSTASRVYAELVRRGVALGEVGRGTFLRAAEAAPPTPARESERGNIVDLELNFSVLPDQGALLAPALARLASPGALQPLLSRAGVIGDAAAREAIARLMARGGWAPEPGSLLFAGRGQQALSACFTALIAPGERLGLEAMTYSLGKGIALRLGLQAAPLAMDEHGVRPDAIAAAHAAHSLKLLYLQPDLHNPLGTTMPTARRQEVAELCRALDITIVEDSVYAFLVEDPLPPLAAHAPERVVVVDSLSKRVAPGLTLGFLSAPPALRQRLASALRLGGWTAQGFGLAAATAWIEDGSIDALMLRKRQDARHRNALARQVLGDGGLTVRGDPRAYHLWLELPDPWRADTFVAAAARRGIAVSPAAEFAAGPGHAPDAVRLALAAPPAADLRLALETLLELALGGPDAALVG